MVASIYPTDNFLVATWLYSALIWHFSFFPCRTHHQTSTGTHTFRRLMLLCRISGGLAIVSPPVEHCQSTKEDLSASVWCDLILYSPLKLYVHGALKERPTACGVIYMCVSRRYWVPLNLSQTSKVLKRASFCMEVLIFWLFYGCIVKRTCRWFVVFRGHRCVRDTGNTSLEYK